VKADESAISLLADGIACDLGRLAALPAARPRKGALIRLD
jgi:hypothetical protein